MLITVSEVTHQLITVSRMGEAKDIWKRLFFVLHNNKQPDDELPTMWTPFKAGNLQDSDLETAIESISHLLPENVRDRLESLLQELTSNALK